jgi:hypothetical protein
VCVCVCLVVVSFVCLFVCLLVSVWLLLIFTMRHIYKTIMYVYNINMFMLNVYICGVTIVRGSDAISKQINTTQMEPPNPPRLPTPHPDGAWTIHKASKIKMNELHHNLFLNSSVCLIQDDNYSVPVFMVQNITPAFRLITPHMLHDTLVTVMIYLYLLYGYLSI